MIINKYIMFLVPIMLVGLISCGGGDEDTSSANSDSTDSTSSSSSSSSTDSSSGSSSTSSSGTNQETLPVFADVPKLSEFTARMQKYGRLLGDKISSEPSASKRIQEVYYDAARTFYQIAEFTGQSEPWHTYARKARNIFVNDYLKPNNYKPAGWWRFPHGLDLDWRIGGNAASKSDLLTLHSKSPRPGYHVYADRYWEQMYSRPVAYTLETNMAAERAGAKRDVDVVEFLVQMALGHIQQWTTGVYLDPVLEDQHIQAFMSGLTTAALIDYYERSVELGSPDARVPAALKIMADWLWTNMWVADVGGSAGSWRDTGGTGYGAFRMRNAKVGANPNPAPMLNQLILPVYAFLYKHNCESTYRSKADLIFSGGVALISNLEKGKFFSQQHRMTFRYLKWRAEGDNAGCNG